MKKFFKALAVLILIAHVFAGLIYAGIIPIGLIKKPIVHRVAPKNNIPTALTTATVSLVFLVIIVSLFPLSI